jgi:hypothetical protein
MTSGPLWEVERSVIIVACIYKTCYYHHIARILTLCQALSTSQHESMELKE